jgi:ABC-type Mn2+/Zn2+ transport system permease subunit
MSSPALLTVDATINLALGVLLAVFPARLVSALGIPGADVAFYPSILGAVLFGIGIALFIERSGRSSGLGLAGAISINLSAGLALAAWLVCWSSARLMCLCAARSFSG